MPTPMSDNKRPMSKASLGVSKPAGSGRFAVRPILASMSRSYHIFKMVLPLMERNKLIPNPSMVGMVVTGQRALI